MVCLCYCRVTMVCLCYCGATQHGYVVLGSCPRGVLPTKGLCPPLGHVLHGFVSLKGSCPLRGRVPYGCRWFCCEGPRKRLFLWIYFPDLALLSLFLQHLKAHLHHTSTYLKLPHHPLDEVVPQLHPLQPCLGGGYGVEDGRVDLVYVLLGVQISKFPNDALKRRDPTLALRKLKATCSHVSTEEAKGYKFSRKH